MNAQRIAVALEEDLELVRARQALRILTMLEESEETFCVVRADTGRWHVFLDGNRNASGVDLADALAQAAQAVAL